MEAPLPPIVVLVMPFEPTLILIPGAIFIRLLKRNAITVILEMWPIHHVRTGQYGADQAISSPHNSCYRSR